MIIYVVTVKLISDNSWEFLRILGNLSMFLFRRIADPRIKKETISCSRIAENLPSILSLFLFQNDPKNSREFSGMLVQINAREFSGNSREWFSGILEKSQDLHEKFLTGVPNAESEDYSVGIESTRHCSGVSAGFLTVENRSQLRYCKTAKDIYGRSLHVWVFPRI